MTAIAILLLASTVVVAANPLALLLQPVYANGDKLDFKKIKNLSNNDGFSVDLQIALSGENVYTAWEDDTPGILDIFFRRGISR